MPVTNTRRLLLGCAITLAALSTPAGAGPEPLPTGAGKHPAAKQAASGATTTGAPSNQPADQPADQAQPPAEGTEGAEQAEAASHAGPSAQAYALARWVQVIGARVCTGPKLRLGDRVSRPDVTDQAQGWRVSVPTFETGRVSAPPARSRAATPDQQTTESPASETPPAETTGEGA
ncbi:MAG: hypothetical protein IT431_00280 [Phycisphaerales bacterium]|nr:hypothetical protein [Phycisphaerales bacterium]